MAFPCQHALIRAVNSVFMNEDSMNEYLLSDNNIFFCLDTHMDSQPATKLEGVLTVLREEIVKGHWPIGENLPNEYELALRFNCSAGTINKAVGILAHEGLVIRRNRVGTRVISNKLKSERSGLELDSVAFVFLNEQHEGIWRTLRGFQEAAQRKGHRVIMPSTGLEYRKEIEVLTRLSEFDVRGDCSYNRSWIFKR